MAHLLGTQNVGALAGSRKLLEGVTVGLDDGSRVGILGPNGAGKSTLLRIVAGTQEPDGGVVTRRDGVRVAVLTQADTLEPEDTVIQAVHPGMEEYEWASDPAVRDIHAGLLADINPAALVGTLAGGQRRRGGCGRGVYIVGMYRCERALRQLRGQNRLILLCAGVIHTRVYEAHARKRNQRARGNTDNRPRDAGVARLASARLGGLLLAIFIHRFPPIGIRCFLF